MRHAVVVAVLWIALTIVTEMAWVAWAAGDMQVVAAVEEAEIIDGAFDFLGRVGIPVFTLVVVMLVYSALVFRGDGKKVGAPIRTNRPVVWVWLAVTTVMSIFITINPGLIGLAELQADTSYEMVVRLEAEQWNWTVVYDDSDVRIEKAEEMVLPVDRRVKFEVVSEDVLHAFWVPAFRVKMDAVPGRTQFAIVTLDRIGDYEEDIAYRLQCAELCGTGHARMSLEVAVVEEAEFEAWIARQGESG